MIHRLSVLATFLLLAILQVCAAFKPPVGIFTLSLQGMPLSVDGHTTGSRAIIDRGGGSVLWHIDAGGSIMDIRSGLYLGCEEKETGTPLTLTMERVQWKIEPVKKGFQIGLEGSDLVFGALPSHIYPPKLGLTEQDKEESQAWRFQPLELDLTPFAPEGDFMFMHENFRFIGIIGREPSSLVYLLNRPSELTIWTVRKEGPRDLVSIQNRETGLYLSYSSDRVDEPLKITRHKSMFRVLTIQNSIVQIITARGDISARAVSELSYGNPPLAGLAVIRKNPNQIWRLRPVVSLDDSPRQYRLPFRRLRSW